MTVAELKKRLRGVPDDLEVVTSGCDHSYRVVHYATKVPAEKSKTREYHEYYGSAHMSDDGEVVDVFHIN